MNIEEMMANNKKVGKCKKTQQDCKGATQLRRKSGEMGTQKVRRSGGEKASRNKTEKLQIVVFTTWSKHSRPVHG